MYKHRQPQFKARSAPYPSLLECMHPVCMRNVSLCMSFSEDTDKACSASPDSDSGGN